jgi:alkanesulfonate monooxygenase SsuD/methylene tetrahydromethanopterin reductase-like flavin-dependent oxidoreductase (luciferase family)
MKLWKKHGTQPRFMRLPEDFDAVVEAGFALAGGPATVREQVAVVVEAAGANYFIAQFSFGDLAHEQVLRSAGLFVEHVMSGSGGALRPGNPKL